MLDADATRETIMNGCKILSVSFSVMMALVVPELALAVPAEPTVLDMQQEDGTAFRARKWGDESRHGWETDFGHTIVFDGKKRGWYYADRAPDGGLMSSGRAVGRDAPPAHVPKRLRPPRGIVKQLDREGRFAPQLKSPSDATAPLRVVQESALQPAPPSSGSTNLPVILVNFSDRTTTNTPQEFQSLLFGTGTYSLKDYYQEVSSGSFTLSPGPAGIVGWVQAPNTHDYYGSNNASGDDMWPGDLVYEAVQAADATVNFANYDGDGDCYVDAVAIVHQGTGEDQAGTPATDIWSHRWTLSSAKSFGRSHYGTYTTNDACTANPGTMVKINDYIMQPERYGTGIATVGVFAHEFGHVMGLPDLYDTDGSSEGVGEWSLMAAGSWTYLSRQGDRPSHLDPWSKYKLGWVAPQKVTSAQAGFSFAPVETTAAVVQLLEGSPASGTGEYFLLENRQQTGFDAGIPASGLVVWHIDESKANNTGEWYPTCGAPCTSHYKVALVQADGAYHLEREMNRGDAGDPFPGTSGVTLLTADTVPSSRLYSGADSGFYLDLIRRSGSTMVADIGFGTYVDRTVTILSTGFESLGQNPPAGWSLVDNAGTKALWRFDNPATRDNDTGGSGGFAIADSDYAGPVAMDTELRTPLLDLSGYEIVTLRFKTLFDHYSNEIASVDVSTSGSAGPWQSLWSRNGIDYGPATEDIDLTSRAAGKANVMIRFRYYDANYSWFWQVDDVTLTGIPRAQHQLAVTVNGSGTVASSPAGISCPESTCSALFYDGLPVTLTATPAADYLFSGWSGACAGTDPCVVTLSGATAVTATFVPNTHSLNVTVSGNGQGTVTSVPAGIACASGTCNGAFNAGSQVELIATPSAGSLFAGWSGDCTGTGACTPTMATDRNVGAAFDPAPTVELTIGAATTLHTTLAAAMAAVADGSAAAIKARAMEFPESLAITGGKSIVFYGGYAEGFGGVAGYSVLRGTVTVGVGSLTVGNLTVR